MQKLHYHNILLTLFLLAAGTAGAQDWGHGHEMPRARKGLNAVLLDAKIWVMGGSRWMHDQLNTVDIYDPALDKWQNSGPAFQYARENSTAQVFNGRIYLFGGRSGNRIISQVEMFDPKAGYWQTVAVMPSPRFGLTSVIVDSAIWIIGGTLANNSPSSRVDVYYPQSNRWEELGADLSTGRSSAMAAIVKGKVYVFGGFFFGPLASYEKYDADLGQWQSAGDMPAPMAGSGYAADSAMMWLVGGTSSSGMTDKVMQFNGEAWTLASSLTRAKSECAAVFYNDKLYVFGGQSGHMMGGMIENEVEIFDIATSVKQPGPDVPEQFELLTAYPNPFTTQTTIEVSMPFHDAVEIWVYDILGRKVSQLYSGVMMKGKYPLAFKAADASGAQLPAGTYFVRLQGQRFQQTKKIFILN